eukprot:scaffold627380_cov83-Attheya_sp.AAC.1
MPTYNTAQSNALAIVPKITGALSLLGSIMIISEITYFDRHKLRRVYHRLVLAMAIFDLFGASAKFLSSWPIPRMVENISFNVGNFESCVFQGFLLHVGVGEPMMSMCLSIYFFLVIHQGWSERKIKSKAEPLFYCFTGSLAFGTAFAAWGMGLFNSSKLWCWIASHPAGCKQSWQNGGETTCTRGDNSGIYRWAFYYAWVWFAIVVVMVLMTLMYFKVRQLEKASLQYSKTWHQENGAPPKELMSRKVATRAFWFVGAFYITWFFPTFNRIWQQVLNNSPPFPLIMAHAIFSPSQGFWNFLVYNRPRFLKFLKERKGKKGESTLVTDGRSSIVSDSMIESRNDVEARGESSIIVQEKHSHSFDSVDSSDTIGEA